MSKRIFITILIIIVIAIALASTYIELIIKSQNQKINSGKVSPFVVYFHLNLSILMDGKPFKIPSQIGIENHLWNNHSLDKFGFLGMPMDEEGKTHMPGMAPIYTTNDKGRITVGSVVERNYTLVDFLNIWNGIDLYDKKVNATVNGKSVTDYRNIILENKEQINLQVN